MQLDQKLIGSRGAIFSDCKKFRYVLYRIWDRSKPKAMCIGLNPSTANEAKDDPTIQNLIRVLTTLGYGTLYMTNLFSLVSSKPEKLRECPNPVMDNDAYLSLIRSLSDVHIFCWGNFPMAFYRAKQIAPMFPGAKCFGKNDNGTPMHPRALVYIKGALNNPSLITF